jgi:hypothetical protein
MLFRIELNDTTNAFKAYRKEVIDGCRPLLAVHFNITVELPLKAIVRGYSWTTIPITWRNRRTGEAKLKIKEMGSHYLFICLYVWLEKYLSCGDYRRDHYLPLTEQSLREVLELVGFEVESCFAKFVPYQMVRRKPAPLLLVRLYLKLPWTWHFLANSSW